MPNQKRDEPDPETKGYPEAQPKPARKDQKAPDANTPHEAHNVPRRKPNSDSG
jgi:hypothetical protein